MIDFLYYKEYQGRLKFLFDNINFIDHNHSNLHQDMFVLTALNGKTNGTYLEIGCNDPIVINNTYLLENKFKWKGVSIDIVEHHVVNFNSKRINPAYCQDALTTDYFALTQSVGLGTIIDYLSIDADPPAITFAALNKIPHDILKFRVITFEHDCYTGKDGIRIRSESRDYLSSLGYELVVNDVASMGHSVEDWYVHPQYVEKSVIDSIKSITPNPKNHQTYFYK